MSVYIVTSPSGGGRGVKEVRIQITIHNRELVWVDGKDLKIDNNNSPCTTFHRQLEFSTLLRFPSSSTPQTTLSRKINMHTKDTGEARPVQINISNGTHMNESSRRSSSTSRIEEFMMGSDSGLLRHVRISDYF